MQNMGIEEVNEVGDEVENKSFGGQPFDGLTVENEEQAWDRADQDRKDKGGGAAEAATPAVCVASIPTFTSAESASRIRSIRVVGLGPEEGVPGLVVLTVNDAQIIPCICNMMKINLLPK